LAVFLKLTSPTTSRSETGAWIISPAGRHRKEKPGFGARVITFGRPLKFYEEFLHPVVHHLHLVVAHHPAAPRNQESRQERPDQQNKHNMSGKIGRQTEGVQDPHSFMRSISRRLLGDDILESGETRTAAAAEGPPLLALRPWG